MSFTVCVDNDRNCAIAEAIFWKNTAVLELFSIVKLFVFLKCWFTLTHKTLQKIIMKSQHLRNTPCTKGKSNFCVVLGIDGQHRGFVAKISRRSVTVFLKHNDQHVQQLHCPLGKMLMS